MTDEEVAVVSSRVQRWREGGEYVDLAGRRVFVVRRDGIGVPIAVVHGYPGSSYDFAGVVEHLERPVLLLDLLGYGFSEKPRDASYSLFEQADLVEGSSPGPDWRRVRWSATTWAPPWWPSCSRAATPVASGSRCRPSCCSTGRSSSTWPT
ncbi:MAG TPA: alpha/beta fold hydrolase [Marmoricola sp.]|nr:alpha/beta fold hydrolase [Marmoricola sp.]